MASNSPLSVKPKGRGRGRTTGGGGDEIRGIVGGLAQMTVDARGNGSGGGNRGEERSRSGVDLPVKSKKKEFMDMLAKNNVFVVQSETGSGKTTMLPQYALEYFGGQAVVVCTQPRRLAAISTAEYVAKLRHCAIGTEVAYAVRFDHNESDASKIIYMTEGVLVNDAKQCPTLARYRVIFIDEAHERTINTDILLGLLKLLLQHRKDLKVIVMSATINAKKFQQFFDHCPSLEIVGRIYSVDVEYVWTKEGSAASASASASASAEKDDDDDQESRGETLATLAAKVVARIHESSETGHILVIMPGEKEILDTCAAISTSVENAATLMVVPLMSMSPDEDQRKAIDPVQAGFTRKCVVATNIVETSITIDGVAHVIDSGLIRVKHFDFDTQIESLDVESISKASAEQRKGRAGRTCHGRCYRLYSEEDYEEMKEIGEPEVLRVELDSMVVQLKALKLDIPSFKFLDRPGLRALPQAVAVLQSIGAMKIDDERLVPDLTDDIGRSLARLPLEPRAGRALLEATKNKVGPDVLSLLAMMSAPPCFALPIDKDAKSAARAAIRNKFAHLRSDHLMLIDLFEQYKRLDDAGDTDGKARLCAANFLRQSAMATATKIRKQLQGLLAQVKFWEGESNKCEDDYRKRLFKTMLAGLCNNVAKQTSTAAFEIADGAGNHGANVQIHRSSTLYAAKHPAAYLFFNDCVQTGGGIPTMQTVSEIKELDWLTDTKWKQVLQGCQSVKPKELKAVHLSRIPAHWTHERLRRLLDHQFVGLKSLGYTQGSGDALAKFGSNNKALAVVQYFANGGKLDGVALSSEQV